MQEVERFSFNKDRDVEGRNNRGSWSGDNEQQTIRLLFRLFRHYGFDKFLRVTFMRYCLPKWRESYVARLQEDNRADYVNSEMMRTIVEYEVFEGHDKHHSLNCEACKKTNCLSHQCMRLWAQRRLPPTQHTELQRRLRDLVPTRCGCGKETRMPRCLVESSRKALSTASDISPQCTCTVGILATEV